MLIFRHSDLPSGARTNIGAHPLESARAPGTGEATSHVTALFDTSTLVYAYAGYAACYADTRVVTRHPPPAGRPPVGRTGPRALSAVSRLTGHCGRVILPTRNFTDMKNPTDMLHSRHTLCDVVEGTGV